MFTLCAPFPFIDLLASGSIFIIGASLYIYRRYQQAEEPVDGNERLMVQLTVMAILAELTFLFFIIAWKPC
jgi:hypothetical protein